MTAGVKSAQPLVGQSTIDLDLIPDGALTSPFSLPQPGNTLYGSGSPEGVETASVGVLYSDTAKTNGAAVWRKDTGTGNTGWLVLAGDTGWRDVTASVLNAWTASSMMIRRVNRDIHFRIEGANSAAATGDTVYTLPAGFTSDKASRMPIAHDNYTIVRTLYAATSSVRVLSYTASMTFGGGRILFNTSDAWPASLPGTAG